jgi:hypothetical protein
MAAIAWRFKGELRVTAIVKASFAFAADAAMPRVDAQPIFAEDVHHAQNQLRSVVHPSDLAPYKKRADVIFTGYAYPPAAGVTSVNVRLGVASGDRVLLDKTLVVGKKGGFARIPVLYEHALASPENPYGEDEGSDDLHIVDARAPLKAAGLGPISRAMEPRKRLLGPVPLPPFGPAAVQIPDTFDFDFFQVAPADQQIPFLRGEEWVLVEGLHPGSPRVCSALPGARAVARIHGLSEHGLPEGRPLALSADELHVSGEEGRVTVTWRGTFAVPSDAALGSVRVVAGVETPDEALAWPDAESIARAEPAEPMSAPRSSSSEATLALPEGEVVISTRAADMTLPVSSSVARAPLMPLPFRAATPGAVPAIANRVSPPRRRDDAGSTLPIDSRPAARVAPLPFQRAAEPPKPAPVAAPPPPPEPAKAEPLTQTLPEAMPSPPVPMAAPAPEAPKAPPAPLKREDVWKAPEPPAPKPAPPPPPKKLPPKVNVANKLYGTRKKG